MRRLLFVVAVLALASLISGCDPGAANSVTNKPANAGNTGTMATKSAADLATLETEVKKLVSDAAASMSKNDVAAFEKMTTDDYMFINPDGRMSTKAERAGALRSGDSKYESVAYDDVKVRVNPYGTGAIVTARATVKGVNMGNKVDGQYRITQIWRKFDDGWKMAHGHATAIAASTAPATSPASNTSSTPETPASNTNSNK